MVIAWQLVLENTFMCRKATVKITILTVKLLTYNLQINQKRIEKR
jgi:hypothetical protein